MTLAPEILTAREAAAYLRVSVSAIHRNAAQLGGFRVGRTLRFSKRVLQHYADHGTLPDPWPTSPASPSTNAPQTCIASAGEKVASDARNADTPVEQTPMIAPSRSVDAFARDFPEYAHLRSS